MNIRIIAVGKVKEKYLQQGIQEYKRRLSHYCNIEIIEVEDEKAPDMLSAAQENIIKGIEGERIMKALRQDAFIISLAIEGQAMSSPEFAAKMKRLADEGRNYIDFIIGGSLGLDEKILKKSDMLLSFSALTFPHQLMRLILLEQICRAFEFK